MFSKKIIAVFLAILMFSVNVFAVAPNPAFNLRRGTTFAIRIMSPISSKGHQTVSAIVDSDLCSNDGKVLIKRGSNVEMKVTKKKAKSCGKPGYLELSCISTIAVDGQNISLYGIISEEGSPKKGLSLGLGIGLGLTFLPIVGFSFLAIQGEQAKVEANTLIPNVTVMGDYNIK